MLLPSSKDAQPGIMAGASRKDAVAHGLRISKSRWDQASFDVAGIGSLENSNDCSDRQIRAERRKTKKEGVEVELC